MTDIELETEMTEVPEPSSGTEFVVATELTFPVEGDSVVEMVSAEVVVGGGSP